jgi:hypothetical protein
MEKFFFIYFRAKLRFEIAAMLEKTSDWMPHEFSLRSGGEFIGNVAAENLASDFSGLRGRMRE